MNRRAGRTDFSRGGGKPTAAQKRTLRLDRRILDALRSGKYSVTPLGDVVNHRYRGRIESRTVALRKDRLGYITLLMRHKGVNFTVLTHRVVALARLGRPAGYAEVVHRNGDKLDIRPENLEWVSHQRAIDLAVERGVMLSGEKFPTAKLNDAQVAEIRAGWSVGESVESLSWRFGVAVSTVRGIVQGASRRAGYEGPMPRSRLAGEFNPQSKLTASLVDEVRELLARGMKPMQIALKYEVSDSTIRRIKHGVAWRKT